MKNEDRLVRSTAVSIKLLIIHTVNAFFTLKRIHFHGKIVLISLTFTITACCVFYQVFKDMFEKFP